MQNKNLWFKRKWYGWGWYPVSWQGYVTTLVYIGAVFAFALTLNDTSPISEIFFMFVLPALFLTITFIRICYAKGESPRWQWGKPKDEDN